jgi:hypothetical protein
MRAKHKPAKSKYFSIINTVFLITHPPSLVNNIVPSTSEGKNIRQRIDNEGTELILNDDMPTLNEPAY